MATITLHLLSALISLTAMLQSMNVTLSQQAIASTTEAAVSIAAPTSTPVVAYHIKTPATETRSADPGVFDVPFFSQFTDISSPKWEKEGCGVTSLAMLIDFYKPGDVTVNRLLSEGLAAGAYLNGAGWTHQGLADLADKHGLSGTPYDLSAASMSAAFAKFEAALKNGPVIASVHYKFEPTNPIPHLVVMTGEEGDRLYFNDPAGASVGGSISVSAFKRAWKKRYISVRPM